jgi:hypothetical protein
VSLPDPGAVDTYAEFLHAAKPELLAALPEVPHGK